jgi:hypothetical protein
LPQSPFSGMLHVRMAGVGVGVGVGTGVGAGVGVEAAMGVFVGSLQAPKLSSAKAMMADVRLTRIIRMNLSKCGRRPRRQIRHEF